jgi:zinc transporter 2
MKHLPSVYLSWGHRDVIANSLAMITDAAHKFADISAFFITIFAGWLSHRKSLVCHMFGSQGCSSREPGLCPADVVGQSLFSASSTLSQVQQVWMVAHDHTCHGWYLCELLGVHFIALDTHGGHVHGDGHDHGGHDCSHGHAAHSHGHSHDSLRMSNKTWMESWTMSSTLQLALTLINMCMTI